MKAITLNELVTGEFINDYSPQEKAHDAANMLLDVLNTDWYDLTLTQKNALAEAAGILQELSK